MTLTLLGSEPAAFCSAACIVCTAERLFRLAVSLLLAAQAEDGLRVGDRAHAACMRREPSVICMPCVPCQAVLLCQSVRLCQPCLCVKYLPNHRHMHGKPRAPYLQIKAPAMLTHCIHAEADECACHIQQQRHLRYVTDAAVHPVHYIFTRVSTDLYTSAQQVVCIDAANGGIARLRSTLTLSYPCNLENNRDESYVVA